MITNQQIEQLMKHIAQKKAVIDRLIENPMYQDYLKLKEIMDIGRFTEVAIMGEKQGTQRLEQQLTQMIQQQKAESQMPPPQPQRDIYEEQLYQQEQEQMEQQPQPQPQPQRIRQAPMQPREEIPRKMPPVQKQRFNPQATQEQDMQEVFQSKKEDIGIDEEINFDGLPEFEDDLELKDGKNK